jgi:predicted PurR-regulated permease PerM
LANLFVRHWRLLALAVFVALFIWVIYLMRLFVLPFATGLVLAYLLLPLVNWLERHLPPRHKWPNFRRVIAILLAFLLVLAIVGGFVYVVITAVINAGSTLVNSAPYFFGQSVVRIQDWFQSITAELPTAVQDEINRDLVEAGVSVGNWIRDTLFNSISSIPDTFKFILGFLVVPFFLFYILKDTEKIKQSLVATLPASVSRHGRSVVNIVERVAGRYIKSQLMLGLIVGYFSFIGLLLMKMPYSLALALLAGVMEMVPTLGPWIAGIVAVVVALALEPDKAIWVGLLYLGIQLLENNLLVPKVQSAYLRIHPAVMIVLLVFGAYVAGFWGILIIGPLAATLVELFKYVHAYYRTAARPPGSEGGSPPPPPLP